MFYHILCKYLPFIVIFCAYFYCHPSDKQQQQLLKTKLVTSDFICRYNSYRISDSCHLCNYFRMNSYLTNRFPTEFDVTNQFSNNISLLERQLSCCGVGGVGDYANLAVPHSCRCVKQKTECSNTTTSYYTGGCLVRLQQTNQIHAYMGGVAAVILCFQMGLLILAPVMIYLNYK